MEVVVGIAVVVAPDPTATVADVHALLALSAAALSGSGDFLGGLASRRGSVTSVVFINHVAGLVVMLALGPLFGGSLDGPTILWGSLAGFSGAVGVLSLYAGFTRSSMAVVSPIAAVGAGAWPVVYDMARGDIPGPVVLAGILLGLVAIWTISSGGRLGANDAVGLGVAFGLAAGLGFGGLLILLSLGSDSSGVWALFPARVAGTAAIFAVILVTTREFWGERAARLPSVAAGVLVTVGNSLFVLATAKGSLAVVSVLASMFPAATVILAWLVLRERLTRQRQVGLVMALIAVGLVAGG